MHYSANHRHFVQLIVNQRQRKWVIAATVVVVCQIILFCPV